MASSNAVSSTNIAINRAPEQQSERNAAQMQMAATNAFPDQREIQDDQ